MSDERSGLRGWVIALLIAVPVLFLCGVGSCCLYFGFGVTSSVTNAAAEAEAYRGRPIGECYDAAFEQMMACSNTDVACRLPGQALFSQCTRVADPEPGFCEQHADGAAACAQRCESAPDRTSCGMVCGQLSVPVGQYCRAQGAF